MKSFQARPKGGILEGKAQIVQGSRMVGGGALRGGMPYARYIPNRVLTLLENIVFGTQMAEREILFISLAANQAANAA
jgi:hypothetical protein